VKFLSSFATGNPHTDLDFFTQGNRTYASVGTLAIGPNAGGQTILQLAEGDEVEHWGATGDFNVGAAGRHAVDIWGVTIESPPPAPRGSLLPGTGHGFAPAMCVGPRARFRAGRLGRSRVGLSRRAVIRKKGRPLRRRKRVLTNCVKGNRRGRVTLGFDRRGKLRFIASTARRPPRREHPSRDPGPAGCGPAPPVEWAAAFARTTGAVSASESGEAGFASSEPLIADWRAAHGGFAPTCA
jgi:hypothetical protein